MFFFLIGSGNVFNCLGGGNLHPPALGAPRGVTDINKNEKQDLANIH